MNLYHVTSRDSAAKIVVDGFRDGRLAMLQHEDLRPVSEGLRSRVSLSDAPVDENEGARSSESCVEVIVPIEVATEHELQEEVTQEDRTALMSMYPELANVIAQSNCVVTEWAIPASILNQFPRRLLTQDEYEALRQQPRPAHVYRHSVDFD